MDNRIDFEKPSRTVRSSALRRVFNQYNTLLILCLKARERALSDKNGKYLLALGLDIVGQKKKREDSISAYFDILQKELEDNAILNLVATFEKLVFDQIPQATTRFKNILVSHYEQQEPFSSSVQAFVKNKQDINNLTGIQNILSGSISVTLENKLRDIFRYRDRIAHGRRFGKDSSLTVFETLESLDETLAVVSGEPKAGSAGPEQ